MSIFDVAGQTKARTPLMFDQESQTNQLIDDEESHLNDRKLREYQFQFIKKLIQSNSNLKFFCVLIAVVLSVTLIQIYIGIMKLQDGSSALLLSNYNVQSLTKDVNVLPIHSHNDEWRKNPFFDALRSGAGSIEADVWYFDKDPDMLFVGHNKVFLEKVKNIDNLYLNHLYNLLEQTNEETRFLSKNEIESSKNGVFYNSPETSLNFYFDIKNENGIPAIKVLEKKLLKFLENGYLTTYDSTTQIFKQGPLTIIITGNAPYEYLSQKELRYMFIDAPLAGLDTEDEAEVIKFGAKYPAKKISITASGSLLELTSSSPRETFFGGLSNGQSSQIQAAISVCHRFGLQIRIWETPHWPVFIRNKVWRQLLDLKTDILNVDDLKGVTGLF
ncbi:hypothetical protein PACTADRAFT_49258 [Pachysolen tannophilus NRRL Y-2460]|uniref:Altered inheritance of mitochondria protein 6 n=1 Tax=Pachysolen tannophilus NRRL Y-2460 TaxID=669874 RepID=A0A1E4TVM8_PACTA|nr:hypothetical protein PACTADRAFT_49258 [Pachysolen tannophilus NRRL Y-2460]